MFGGKNEKQNGMNGQVQSPNVSNSIVDGTVINGNISAPNDIRIDGSLIGKLECKGRVIMGPTRQNRRRRQLYQCYHRRRFYRKHPCERASGNKGISHRQR